MAERYNQQDGGPTTQPDSGEIVSDSHDARPATVGERSTEEGVAGQGLGQISGAGGERGDSTASAAGNETPSDCV
ncbi:MAG: hypothetical protein M3430_20440 [Acidobacteriota bacterium]|nr:hypothetical protein [Acidobacteriota bacterium]